MVIVLPWERGLRLDPMILFRRRTSSVKLTVSLKSGYYCPFSLLNVNIVIHFLSYKWTTLSTFLWLASLQKWPNVVHFLIDSLKVVNIWPLLVRIQLKKWTKCCLSFHFFLIIKPIQNNQWRLQEFCPRYSYFTLKKFWAISVYFECFGTFR